MSSSLWKTSLFPLLPIIPSHEIDTHTHTHTHTHTPHLGTLRPSNHLSERSLFTNDAATCHHHRHEWSLIDMALELAFFQIIVSSEQFFKEPALKHACARTHTHISLPWSSHCQDSFYKPYKINNLKYNS